MSYYVKYSVACNKGTMRLKNQDNFWCMGTFLKSDNDGLAELISGTVDVKDFPVFAVFDGMGGQQQGEVAAHIASLSFDSVYKNAPKFDIAQFLLSACAKMNEAICLHTSKEQLHCSGTTAAILAFGKTGIYVCNVGDSRIYQFSGNKLAQISQDHIEDGAFNIKPPLTQNLGIPVSDFVILPYVAKGEYNNRDRYLVCSDGLTDMVSDDEIAMLIAGNDCITKNAELLVAKALEAGGRDNITLILCEVRRTGLWIFN